MTPTRLEPAQWVPPLPPDGHPLPSGEVEGDPRSEFEAVGEHATRGWCCTVRNVVIVVILLIVVLVLLLGGALFGLAFELFWLALTGLIIGALGRLVLPGRQKISLLATALVGVAASLLGGILANLFDAGWLVRSLVAVAVAGIGITLFASSEERRDRTA